MGAIQLFPWIQLDGPAQEPVRLVPEAVRAV